MNELQVAWVDEALHGKVGITLHPGRRDLVPGGHDRDMEQDVETLKRLGVERLILLSDDTELDFASAASLPRLARSNVSTAG